MRILKPAILKYQHGKDLSKTDRVNRLVRNSSMSVIASPENATTPESLIIEVTGELANIPKLKQSRKAFGNRVVTDPNFLEKMEALDRLWMIARHGKPKLNLGKAFLSMAMILTSKAYDSDAISSIETVMDWFESPFKTKRDGKPFNRGWGIGIIDNDRQITPLPLHSGDVGPLSESTTILIRPFSAVREELARLVAVHYFDGQ